MATLTDLAQHPVQEQDWVAVSSSLEGPFIRGRVDSISTVMDRGPYNGGTKLTIVHKIEIMIPPGHTGVPVMKVPPSEKELRESEAARTGAKPESKSPLLVK